METEIPENNILLVAKTDRISFPGITVESARTASELLQRDYNEHDGFTNPKGTNSVPSNGYQSILLTHLLA